MDEKLTLNERPAVAYVEAVLPQSVKDYLKNVLKSVVQEDQFYTSPEVPRINGDVTQKAHLTFFYGLDAEIKDNPELQSLVNSMDLSELKLDKFDVMMGYQGLYKILIVKVIDENKQLATFVNKIRKFSKRPNSYEFKPHITLAYVSPDYSLPITQPELKESIEVESLQVSI